MKLNEVLKRSDSTKIMDEKDLNAIRSTRLSEIQGASGGQNKNNNNEDKEELRHTMLSQILDTSAAERLSRVRIVKSERADAVEQYIIKLATMGGISRKLSENDIVEILDGLSRGENRQSKGKIVFNRKSNIESDNEDDDEDDFFD